MSHRRQTDRVTTPIRAPLRPGLLPYITLLRGLNGAIKCFYYYYYYYLTRVLNSQGMKKNTQCNTNKVQKSSLNEPDSSSSSFTYYYYYSQSTNAIMSITRRYEPQLDNISLCTYSAQYLQSHRPSRTLLSSTHESRLFLVIDRVSEQGTGTLQSVVSIRLSLCFAPTFNPADLWPGCLHVYESWA